jgi:hypothetical protein
MGVAGKFIKLDSEIFRIRIVLKGRKNDPALRKSLNDLLEKRSKLLTEFDQQARSRLAGDRYSQDPATNRKPT